MNLFTNRPTDEVPVSPMEPSAHVDYLLDEALEALRLRTPRRACLLLAQAVDVAARGEGFNEVGLRRRVREVAKACGREGLAP